MELHGEGCEDREAALSVEIGCSEPPAASIKSVFVMPRDTYMLAELNRAVHGEVEVQQRSYA